MRVAVERLGETSFTVHTRSHIAVSDQPKANGGTDVVGPILMGLQKPIHALQRGAEVHDIVHMATIAVRC